MPFPPFQSLSSGISRSNSILLLNVGIIETGPKTSHPPEKTTEYHPPHTSAARSGPRPCQTQIPRPFSGHTHCLSQTQTHSDRPCRIPESQSIPSACTDGTDRYLVCHCRHK